MYFVFFGVLPLLLLLKFVSMPPVSCNVRSGGVDQNSIFRYCRCTLTLLACTAPNVPMYTSQQCVRCFGNFTTTWCFNQMFNNTVLYGFIKRTGNVLNREHHPFQVVLVKSCHIVSGSNHERTFKVEKLSSGLVFI